MRKIVSFVKVVSGGFNVMIAGQFFAWTRFQDWTGELMDIALMTAF